MKVTLILCSILFCLKSYSQDLHPIRALTKIEKTLTGPRLGHEGKDIPMTAGNPEVENKIKSLTGLADVLVEGHVSYQRTQDDHDRLRPIFVIEKLTVISLKELGKDAIGVSVDPLLAQNVTSPVILSPSFLITKEVASALTITGTFLLMDSLAAHDTDPQGRRDIGKALIISAGSMATLLFLYEQLSGKATP